MDSSNPNQKRWIDEHHNGTRYGLEGQIIVTEKSAYQEITIFESKKHGRGLLLDGCWMATENHEKYYHECLVHPALCSSQSLKKVLIIGGGDGGSARECLLHQEIEHLDLVEIDQRVIELSQKYLTGIGGKAWRDRRLHINIKDGTRWVAEADNSFYDVIIVDGSDPKGPAEGLFDKKFFQNCHRILSPGGVFATQSESPEAFQRIHIETVKILRDVFEYADPLYGWVPIYPSGIWSWTFAAKDNARYLQPITTRGKKIEEDCEIWSLSWQKAAFNAIPAFVERELNK